MCYRCFYWRAGRERRAPPLTTCSPPTPPICPAEAKPTSANSGKSSLPSSSQEPEIWCSHTFITITAVLPQP